MRTCFERLVMMVVALAWMLLWCAAFCGAGFEISSHWLVTTEDDSYVSYKTENTSSWWVAANTVCTRSGGHLFVPQKSSSLDDLTNLLDENKVYWVGGFQYSSLIWTEDASRYYMRLGSTVDVYGSYVKPSTIDNNSPLTCNVKCGNNSGLFGLKGRSCYCLGHRSRQRMLRLNIENMTNTAIRCPGDYNELCGDDTRISVYAGDAITISNSGTCGYVRKIKGNTRKLQLHLDDDCTRERFYAYTKPAGETSVPGGLRCHRDVCVGNTNITWPDADWKTRGLLKVTDANRGALYDVMYYNEYWIGLKRLEEYKWINGNSVPRNMTRRYLDKRCLGIRRDSSRVNMAWYSCSDTYRAVCQSSKPDNTEDDRGIYQGVVASVLASLMLCLTIAAMHFKRKSLYCFKADDETDRGHYVNSPSSLQCSRPSEPRLTGQSNNVNATDRNMLILDAGPCDGEAVYSEIDSPDCHGSSDPYTESFLPFRAAGSEGGEYNTTRQVQQVRRDDTAYNHIHVGYYLDGSDQDGKLYHTLLRV
ncbi:uncharacterized protein [Haliotis asinina]|uniref:uncharacterized protein n=1 Tax=Haliotis asinina TaxID=109174 RepID=UPI00353210B9